MQPQQPKTLRVKMLTRSTAAPGKEVGEVCELPLAQAQFLLSAKHAEIVREAPEAAVIAALEPAETVETATLDSPRRKRRE